MEKFHLPILQDNPFEAKAQNKYVLGKIEEVLREYKQASEKLESKDGHDEDEAPIPPSLNSILERNKTSELDYPDLYRSIVEMMLQLGIDDSRTGIVARIAVSHADDFDLSAADAAKTAEFALDNGFIEAVLQRPDILRRLSKEDSDKLFANMLKHFDPNAERDDAALKIVSNVFPLMTKGAAWPWKISAENVKQLQDIYQPYLAKMLKAALYSEYRRPSPEESRELAMLIEDEEERESILHEIAETYSRGE